MDVDAARRLLGLDAEASAEAASSAFAERLSALEARAASAPTEALRGKFARQIDELRAAHDLLTGAATPFADDDPDLPMARPSTGAAEPAPAAGAPVEAHGLVLGERVWAGGGAAAHLATSTEGERLVVVLPAGDSDAATLEAVAAAWTRVSHRDLGVTSGELRGRGYVAFRADDGATLRAEMEAARKVRRLPAVESAFNAVADLARRLGASAVLLRPRDLTPESVWRTAGGDLLPLSLAAGTQAGGTEQTSLGRLLWEWVTGRPADEETDLRKARTEASQPLAKALTRVLARDGRRFASLEALADAFSGQADRVRLPGVLGEWLPALDRRHLMIGGAAFVAVAALALSYPAWQGAAPWKGLSSGQEAARLSGVVRVMSRRAEAQLYQARAEAERTEQEALRLQERLEGLNSAADYDEVLPRYIQADLEKARAAARRDGLQTRNAADLEAAQLRLAEAEALMSAGNTGGALERFQALEAEYRRLSAVDGEIRAAGAKADAAMAARLAGSWSDGDCATPSVWTFDAGKLSVTWPGQGTFRERLIGTDGDTVFTLGEAPEVQVGHVFRYRLEGDQLSVEQMGSSPSRMRLKRCSGN